MKGNDYLTDDELMQLIASVENETLLPAPDYLKDAILKKSAPRQLPRQHELLIFSAKIMTAAAASIALLFTMPDFEQLEQLPQRFPVRQEAADYSQEDSLLRKFNQKANALCGMISDGTNSIFRKENHENDK